MPPVVVSQQRIAGLCRGLTRRMKEVKKLTTNASHRPMICLVILTIK